MGRGWYEGAEQGGDIRGNKCRNRSNFSGKRLDYILEVSGKKPQSLFADFNLEIMK